MKAFLRPPLVCSLRPEVCVLLLLLLQRDCGGSGGRQEGRYVPVVAGVYWVTRQEAGAGLRLLLVNGNNCTGCPKEVVFPLMGL